MKKAILILLIILIPVSVFGANVYIDSSYGSGGDGSCTAPYDSIKDISWSAKNDYYLEESHVEQISKSVSIKVDGTSQNRIIIGAYTKNGEICTPIQAGNSSSKPIIRMSPADKDEILVIKGSYITVQDIELQDGDSGVRVVGDSIYGEIDGVIIQYNTFTRGIHGVRVLKAKYGADMNNGQILYNIVDLDGSQEKEDDCIDLYSYSGSAGNISGWTIKGNKVDSCPHKGIYVSGNDNIVEENYISDHNNSADGCIELASQGGGVSDGTIVRYNYCEGVEYFQVYGTENARIHHNVIDCAGAGRCTDSYLGDTGIKLDVVKSYPDRGNSGTWVYNNTLINLPNESSGLRVRTRYGGSGKCVNCRFYNNIVTGDGTNTSNACFYILDEGNTVDMSDVHWYNNICYNWGDGDDYIAIIEGMKYRTAPAFNSSNKTDAVGNLTSNPQLRDISNQKYWPASTASMVWQSGYNTGSNYNSYLLETSNFSRIPSKVFTRKESKHNIGAYTLEGSNQKPSNNVSTPSNLRIRK